MAKQIIFGEEARHALKKGIDTLANAVNSNSWPQRPCGSSGQKMGRPQIVDDGVTIAKEIELPEVFENMGAQLGKRSCHQN